HYQAFEMSSWLCCWILCYSCFCTSYTTSFLLYQSLELTLVTVGGKAEFQCSLEKTNPFCYMITWHKIKLRTGELTTVKQSDSLDDTKHCVLTLQNISFKDSGRYFCVTHSSSFLTTGNGSRLIVTSADQSVPELSVFYSPPEDGFASVHLQCLVQGVVPIQVKVIWKIGDKVHFGWTESAWTDDTDSATEFTRAHLSVPATTWTEGHEIQCIAEFRGKNISKTLKRYVNEPVFSLLVYAGCAAALLTIFITIIMSVILYKDLSVAKKFKSFMQTDAKHKVLHGKIASST
ncbi:hypothetical protein DNTS_023830, partial [Danionella cerebrum]